VTLTLAREIGQVRDVIRRGEASGIGPVYASVNEAIAALGTPDGRS
jgi:hypothetical protein